VAGQARAPEHHSQVQEFSYDKGLPYLALEWFPAPNLKQFLRQDRQQIEYLLPKIIIDGTEALTHFVQSSGGCTGTSSPTTYSSHPDGEVKLIDFALATKVKKGLASGLRPPFSRSQGTRSYMSPEQILGKPLDERADLYSWGCTVFEVVCGRPPFTGFSGNELLQKHLSAAVPNLEAFNRNITPEFSKLIRSTLAKRPSQRPESIQAFRDALKNTPIFRHAPKPPSPAEKT
jgi:eukaryotic-like serine/threonine-protein kinase